MFIRRSAIFETLITARKMSFMNKKFFYCLAVIFCFCSELKGIESLSEEKNCEKTFYAISSLQFYFDKMLSSRESFSATDEIIFEEEDIFQLWENAYSFPDTAHTVDQAYIYYCQAINHINDEELYHHFCLQANLQLNNAWQELDRQLLDATFSHLYHAENPSNFYPNVDDNPNFNDSMRQRIRPHLLPLKHQAKLFLDEIFGKCNAIQNFETFKKMGFVKIAQNTSGCIVATHPNLKKYVFKVYLCNLTKQKLKVPSWEALAMRCEGAANIRNLIKKKKIIHFKVPDKWLYVLPANMSAPLNPEDKTQLVILVAKKMSIESTTTAWKHEITHEHLDELYCILSHGYGSTHFETNVPYTKKKKFAFIDTEHPKRVLSYEKVKRYLSPKMNAYWDKLVKKGGNPNF